MERGYSEISLQGDIKLPLQKMKRAGADLAAVSDTSPVSGEARLKATGDGVGTGDKMPAL